jgi:membrane-associated phospholipid phosphatase
MGHLLIIVALVYLSSVVAFSPFSQLSVRPALTSGNALPVSSARTGNTIRTNKAAGIKGAFLSSTRAAATLAAFSSDMPAAESRGSSGKAAALAFNSVGESAKFIVSGIAGILVLLSSTWSPIYYIIIAVFNAILSKVIKKILKHPRPSGAPKGGYGMPSSHAQSLFYFFTVLSIVFYRDHGTPLTSALSVLLALYAISAR